MGFDPLRDDYEKGRIAPTSLQSPQTPAKIEMMDEPEVPLDTAQTAEIPETASLVPANTPPLGSVPAPQPILHQRQVDKSMELAVQERDQKLYEKQVDDYARDQTALARKQESDAKKAQTESEKAAKASELAGRRWQKGQGVEYEYGADGVEVPKRHEDGSLKFTPKVLSPFERDEKNEAYRVRRNDRGEQVKDYFNQGKEGVDYHIDPQTGEKYVSFDKDGVNQREVIGQDELIPERNKVVSEQKELRLRNEEGRIALGESRDQFRESEAVLKEREKEIEPLRKNYEALKLQIPEGNSTAAEAAKAYNKALNDPEYVALREQTKALKKTINDSEKASNDRDRRIVKLARYADRINEARLNGGADLASLRATNSLEDLDERRAEFQTNLRESQEQVSQLRQEADASQSPQVRAAKTEEANALETATKNDAADLAKRLSLGSTLIKQIEGEADPAKKTDLIRKLRDTVDSPDQWPSTMFTETPEGKSVDPAMLESVVASRAGVFGESHAQSYLGALEQLAGATSDTQLSPEQEATFQAWKAKYAPDDSGYDYDFRGAFLAGLKPGEDGHWPDTFKKPNHPTFSNESQYAKGENAKYAGRWKGEEFVPSKDSRATLIGNRPLAEEIEKTRELIAQQAEQPPIDPAEFAKWWFSDDLDKSLGRIKALPKEQQQAAIDERQKLKKFAGENSLPFGVVEAASRGKLQPEQRARALAAMRPEARESFVALENAIEDAKSGRMSFGDGELGIVGGGQRALGNMLNRIVSSVSSFSAMMSNLDPTDQALSLVSGGKLGTGQKQKIAGDIRSAVNEVAKFNPQSTSAQGFNPSSPSWWIENATPSIAELGIDLGLSALTGPAAPVAFMTLSGAKMAGDAYGDAVDWHKAHGVDPTKAEALATAEGLIVGTLGALLDKIPGGQFLTRNKGGQQVTMSFIRNRMLRKGAMGFTAESLPEIGQELTSMLAEAGFRDESEAFRGSFERLASAGVLGGFVGAGVDIAIHGEDAPSAPDLKGQAAQNYRAIFEQVQNLRGKMNSARTNGDNATLESTKDAFLTATKQLHQVANQVIGDTPEARRAAKIAAPQVDMSTERKAWESHPEARMAAIEIGRQVRDIYAPNAEVNPETDVAVQEAIGAAVIQDLASIAKQGTITADKAARLDQMGLLEVRQTPEGPVSMVTDDGLALLPQSLRDQISKTPSAFRVTTTEGPAMRVFDTLVRGGEQRVLQAYVPKAPSSSSKQPSTPSETFEVTVESKLPTGETQTNTIQVPANSAEEAAQAVRRSEEASGNTVVNISATGQVAPMDVTRENSDQLDAGVNLDQELTSTKAPTAEESSVVQDTLNEIEQDDLTILDQFTLSDPKTKEGVKARKAVAKVIADNKKMLTKLGIRIGVGSQSTKGGGLQMTTSGILLIDPDRIAKTLKNTTNPEGWIKQGIIEEIIHRAQFLASGSKFDEIYASIFNDPNLPKGLVKAARKAYNGFDNLDDAAKGAEIVRQVIQGKWQGTITERMYKAIEQIVNYLKGLDVSQSELLSEAIRQTESVLKKAGFSIEESVTKKPSDSINTGRESSVKPTAIENVSDQTALADVQPGESGEQRGTDSVTPSEQGDVTEPATGVEALPADEPPVQESGEPQLEQPSEPVDKITEKLKKLSAVPVDELADTLKNRRSVTDYDLADLTTQFLMSNDLPRAKIAQDEGLRRFEQDTLQQANDDLKAGTIELMDAIEQMGGLPLPKSEGPLSGELREIQRESKRGRRPGFFNKNAIPLDQMQSQLSKFGFQFADLNDFLTQLRDRAMDPQNRPVYGNKAENLYAAQTGDLFDGGFNLETQTEEGIKGEKAQAAKEAKRQAMLAKRDAKLTGDAGDLTADIFGEGDTPLFNQRRDLSKPEVESLKMFGRPLETLPEDQQREARRAAFTSQGENTTGSLFTADVLNPYAPEPFGRAGTDPITGTPTHLAEGASYTDMRNRVRAARLGIATRDFTRAMESWGRDSGELDMGATSQGGVERASDFAIEKLLDGPSETDPAFIGEEIERLRSKIPVIEWADLWPKIQKGQLEYIGTGSEGTVYKSGNFVYKIHHTNSGGQRNASGIAITELQQDQGLNQTEASAGHVNLLDTIRKYERQALLPGAAPTEVLGVTDDAALVTKQVAMDAENDVTQPEIDKLMEDMGGVPISITSWDVIPQATRRSWAVPDGSGNWMIGIDIRPGNVLRDMATGQPFLTDGVLSPITPEVFVANPQFASFVPTRPEALFSAAPEPFERTRDKSTLVERYRPLALSIAEEYSNIPGVDPRQVAKDTQGEALRALTKAADRFNESRGEFAGFADRVIRNAMNDRFKQELKQAQRYPVTVDAPLSEDGQTLGEVVPSEAQDPALETARAETQAMVNQAVESLPARVREVIVARNDDATLRELADQLGISYEGVRQIQNRGLKMLREKLREMGVTGVDGDGVLYTAAPAPFYSAMERQIDTKIQGKSATVDQVKAILRGAKPEEVKWSGVEQAIERIASENGGKVPKQALVDYLRNDGTVRLEEVAIGEISKQQLLAEKQAIQDQISESTLTPEAEEARNEYSYASEYRYPRPEGWEERRDAAEANMLAEYEKMFGPQYRRMDEIDALLNNAKEPQYASYQLPGGSNYREVVLAMPMGEPSYTSNHFPSIPNYVAHMRLNERADSEGAPGLFIEEIQSDRHQQGREKGYKEDRTPLPDKPLSYSDVVVGDDIRGWGSVKDIREGENGLEFNLGSMWIDSGDFSLDKVVSRNERHTQETSLNDSGIADAPFRKDWPLQMFKRALRDAVASGKSWIGWTNGTTQADRYDLSKQVDAINAWRGVTFDGLYDIDVITKEGKRHSWTDQPAEKLPDLIGKELAQKIANDPKIDTEGVHLKGLDLKVGGEGMQGFYDNILPKEIGKYVKQWGGKVEQGSVGGKELPYRVELEEKEGEPGRLVGSYSTEKEAYEAAMRLGPGHVITMAAAEDSRKEKPFNASIWKVQITPEMRKSVSEAGQALFTAAPGPTEARVGEQLKQIGEEADNTEAPKPDPEKTQALGSYIYSKWIRGRKDHLNYVVPGAKDLLDSAHITNSQIAAALRGFSERMQENVMKSFGYKGWWNKGNTERMKRFSSELLPTAARLNATKQNLDGTFQFSDFDMRAGELPISREKAMGMNDVPITLKNGVFIMGRDGEALRVQQKTRITNGKEETFWQLYRSMPADVQEGIYNAFTQRYPEVKHVLDSWINPNLRKAKVQIGGVQVPAFNRFALQDFYSDTPFGDIGTVEGYTPDVYETKSLAGMAANILSRHWTSPGREYKSGEARERGQVKNLFEGFNTRAAQAHSETRRRQLAEDLLKISLKPIPANGVIPTDHVRYDADTLNQLLRAHTMALGLSGEEFKALKQIAKQGDDGQTLLDFDEPSRKRLFQLAGELGAKAAEYKNHMISKEALAELNRPLASTYINNALLRLIDSGVRGMTTGYLANPFTLMTNVISNEIFRTMWATRQAIHGLMMAPFDKLESKFALRNAANLVKGMITDRWFSPGARERIDELVPPEIFSGNNNFGTITAGDFDKSAGELFRELNISSGILKAMRYGDVDTRVKQQLAFAAYMAHADMAADEAGIKGKNRKEWKRDWILSKAPDSVHREVYNTAVAVALDYSNVPFWLDEGTQVKVGDKDITAESNLLRRAMMPFAKFPYNFTRQLKRWTVGSILDLVKGKTRAEKLGAASNLIMMSMLFGLARYMFKDDEEGIPQIGRNYDDLGKELEGAYKTGGRVNITNTPMGRSLKGALDMFGLDTTNEDYWMRIRTLPYATPMLAMGSVLDYLGNMSASNFGQMQDDTAAVISDLASEGILLKMFNASRGVRGPYDRDKNFSFMVGENFFDMLTGKFIPPPLLRTLNALIDPVQRRTGPSRALGTDPGPLEAFQMKIPGASRNLPPAGRVATGAAGGEAAVRAQAQLAAMGMPSSSSRTYVDMDDGKAVAKTSYVAPSRVSIRPRWIEAVRAAGANVKPLDRTEYKAALRGDDAPSMRP